MEHSQQFIYLHSVNAYISDIKTLTEKIDDAQQRTIAIENMGEFFRDEIQQIESRKGAINQAVGSIDETLLNAITQLKENAEARLTEFNKAAINQQEVLEYKLEETTKIVSELEKLPEVKETMSKLEQATNEQNRNLERLIDRIEKLAEMKATDSVIVQSSSTMPLWEKILLIISGGLVAIASLNYLVPQVIQWFI